MKDFKKYLISKNIVPKKSFAIIWIGLLSYMFFAKQILGLLSNLSKSLNILNSYLKTLSPPWIEHPGAWYYVINRGRQSESIFQKTIIVQCLLIFCPIIPGNCFKSPVNRNYHVFVSTIMTPSWIVSTTVFQYLFSFCSNMAPHVHMLNNFIVQLLNTLTVGRQQKIKLELQFCAVLSSNWQPITSSQHPILNWHCYCCIKS